MPSLLLWAVIAILVVLWLLGFMAQIGSGLIHPLLVVAFVVLVVNLLTARSTV
ncbi:MAG TPA: lmo0937 family membrane protein [Nitrolancea sp.]|nr:lmo0937 family membrane protein [Nitrolancea sp.]